jgi:hypothetical protein
MQGFYGEDGREEQKPPRITHNRDIDAEYSQKLTDLHSYYDNLDAKLKDPDFADILADDKAWEKAESYTEFDPEKYDTWTDKQRQYFDQERFYAMGFKEKRLKAIEDLKLANLLDEIENKKPTTEERLEKLMEDGGKGHKALFDAMTRPKGKKK